MGSEIKKGQVWVFKNRPDIVIMAVIKQGFVVSKSVSYHDSFPFLYSLQGFEDTFINACKGVQLLECKYEGTTIIWDNDSDQWIIPNTGEFEYLNEAQEFIDNNSCKI